MPCNANELRHVPLFSLFDEDELYVLSQQVEVRDFAAKQRIYKAGEISTRAFVMMSGAVQVTLLDEDGQEVLFSEPRHGDFFGFASMLEGIEHHTTAVAIEDTTCLEVDRNDIAALLEKKPQAGIDMLTVLSREIHAAQGVIRERAMRNPNELIDEQETFGERIADIVASFGGSWTFIILFLSTMTGYVVLSIILVVTRQVVGSLPLHPAQSVSLHVGSHSSAGHHDEPEPPGHQRPSTFGARLRSKPPRGIGDPRSNP